MKFLCLVYFEPQRMRALSAVEVAELRRKSAEQDDVLRERGKLIAATPLRPVDTAVTIRTIGGKLVTTDGPFAETKEVLGGFLYIEADDMDEALRIAAEVPMAQYGSIEVRQTQEQEKCGT
jgi:hypothetical protein